MKKIALLLLVGFVIAQFFRPEKNAGNLASITAFEAETKPPTDVKLILETTCYDCHSNITKYPWYNSITPVNYWINSHIKDGKKHLNVSNWQNYSTKRKDHKFDELIEEVEEGEMPLKSYAWTHSGAKLSEDQITSVLNWAKQVRTMYALKPKPE